MFPLVGHTYGVHVMYNKSERKRSVDMASEILGTERKDRERASRF